MNVENWLHGIGLSQYAEVLRDNGIGADVLADLTEPDLEKLGLNLAVDAILGGMGANSSGVGLVDAGRESP